MPEQGTAVKTSLFAAAEIDRIAPHPTSRQGDRPPYSTERMVRVLVLQQLYGISDEGLEYQLLDRLSFQRFCSLHDSSSIPDARTIWAFRERSYKAGGANVLFETVQHQLQQYGFHACGGQIIDASLVKALIHHVRKNEKKSLKKAQIPSGWNTARQRQKNTDASWTKKQGKSQSDCQKRRNKRIASPRTRVEQLFGVIEEMDGKQVRTIGLKRATFNLSLKAAVYNLRRLCTLKECGVIPC